MAKEFIIAIELGSSEIRGVAGKKNQDGSISILAVAQEDSSGCIHKGVIYKLDRTVQCLQAIISKLETSLKSKIAHVYVGVGGQSIRSVKNIITKELVPGTVVSQDLINEMMDANHAMPYPDMEIMDAFTQEYKVDNQYQLDPVGIQCATLEGNFLNILWRQKFYSLLNKCFKDAGIHIIEMYLAPLALADSVLTESERRSGCMLVDIGADTTTISVYYKNILRHMAVIPLGGSNITKDIASLQIEEEQAEELKLKYGTAYSDHGTADGDQEITLDDDRKVTRRRLAEIIEARMEEIIRNAWYQMPTEYTEKMLGGIILTGGGSNMSNIIEAFRKFTPIQKVRIAKFVSHSINASQPEITAHDGRMNTLLSLLSRGDENCAGPEIGNADLFTDNNPTPNGTSRPPRDISEITGTGIVPTEEERQRAAEIARKEAEEKARKEAEEEERRRKEEEEARKRENSLGKKMTNKIKSFFHQIITEDE